ncbi:hypothetical protein QBC36DRAFT_361384 [Triangularia setosa]|uniref:RRM domain-containing protein n=1 Tax=Triangularia setosa TaxID=2587417 RepID=A0AAN6WCZ6_9PEZI|nr:hypothetical protein QBC36DRAFT_361384 [Podospora setosa]
MSRSQPHHHQGLVLVTVPPGCATGLYYITIANFSHSTTWKDLRTFVSQVCEVDFCQTYDPTSGFVRVKGLENFEKAYQFLDGNTLHYRCLQADARNRDQPTVVKLPSTDYHAIMLLKEQQRGRVVDDPSALQPAPEPYYTYPGSYPADMRRNSECTSRTQYGTDHWNYPAYTNSQDYPAMTTSPTTPALYQDLSSSFSNPYSNPGGLGPYYNNSSSSPYFLPTTTNLSSISTLTSDFSDLSFDPHAYPPSTSTPQPPTEAPVVFLENRKIILLGLDKRRISQARVADILATFCGDTVPGQVERIEVPISQKSGKAKGTAFVTFGSAEIALGAIECLNGVVVGEKRVTARMAEGVAAVDGSGGSVEEQKRERRKERKAAGGGSGLGGNNGENNKEGAPVVVDGSRRKGAREGAPVIVDGSGGRGGRGGRA